MTLSPKNEERIRNAIVSTLETYPRLSLSMIGSHVRPYSQEWRPVLEAMIKEGLVNRNVLMKNNRGVFIHTLASADALLIVAAS